MVLAGREDVESLLNEKMKGKNKMDYKVTHTPSVFLFSLSLVPVLPDVHVLLGMLCVYLLYICFATLVYFSHINHLWYLTC